MERYYSFNSYMKERFGGKVYKLALDAGMTCPNRDGTLGTGGCIFCAGGAGEFSEKDCGDLQTQIERAKSRIRAKTDAEKFIAYFQSYTNTYAPAERLEALFFPVADLPEITAVSVATRPDCLGGEVLDVLERLRKKKPLFVELGLQTMHEESARLIRRGYPLSVYERAVKDLNGIGAEVVTHVILGLPRESAEMMEETVRYVGRSGARGIKLQLLHVLAGTELQKMYERGEFSVLSADEYIGVLCRMVEALPPDIVVHRLTGDAPRRLLVAPAWSADKKRVLNAIRAEFERRNVIQGKTCQ